MKSLAKEFLNAIGIAILALILVFAFISASQAADPSWDDLDDIQKSAITCAAVNILVAAHMDDGVAKEVIHTVSDYWIKTSVQVLLIDKKYIEYAFLTFNTGYENGNFTWDELVDGSEECAKLKLEIEADKT